MKIKMREDCNKHFLMCGRIFIKKGEEKEYNHCQELRELLKKDLIEEVKESSTEDDVESK